MGIEIIAAAIIAGVSPNLLYSICKVESGHNQLAYVHNDGGSPSYGLCQIKLNTARSVGFKGNPSDLLNGATNALYAALYLKAQLKRFKTVERAVSAYNCGRPCNNAKYVRKVMGGRKWTIQSVLVAKNP